MTPTETICVAIAMTAFAVPLAFTIWNGIKYFAWRREVAREQKEWIDSLIASMQMDESP